MLVIDSNTAEKGIFNTLFYWLQEQAYTYKEIRNIVVMNGDILLYRDTNSFGFLLLKVEKTIRKINTLVDAIILIDRNNIEDIDSSIDNILNKYGITWEPGHGFFNIVSAIKELDTTDTLSNWIPEVKEKTPQYINATASSDELDSFLEEVADEYEELECPFDEYHPEEEVCQECEHTVCEYCDQCNFNCLCDDMDEEIEDDFSDEEDPTQDY